MTPLKTAAVVAKQIDLTKALEAEPPIRTSAPPCGAVQASQAERLPTVKPIRLNTMPYSASGPGGPSLTSRRH
jgi:hypothetical protein